MTEERWKSTLRSAVSILRALEGGGTSPLKYTMGGGTVLALRFEHRLSRGIDLFISDARDLSHFSARRNDYVASVASGYSEQANCVALELPQGSVNFVVSARAIPTEISVEILEFGGECIRLDTTAEILGKKLLYESYRLRPRDVFDMSAVIEFDVKSAATAVRTAASKAAILDRRLDELGHMRPGWLEGDVLALDRGRHLLPGMIERVRRFIQQEAPLAGRERNRFDPMATVRSAIENSSMVSATAAEVLVALRTGEGESSHLRALFADVAFEALIGVGIRYGISNGEIGRAYAIAARSAGARNEELDGWRTEQLETSLQP